MSLILKNYAVDYKNWNHGMPDLILWNKDKVMFSEVKSENDRLSDVQISWLNFFKSANIEAEACYINRDECEKPIKIFTSEIN